MTNKTPNPNEVINQHFTFKNAETSTEIAKAISQCEGILPENLNSYIFFASATKQAQHLIEMKQHLTKFWTAHQHLSLSELVGLTNLALLDIQLQTFKKGDAYKESFMKKKS